jgi:transcriptional regulator with XRE-family HTH domain
MNNTLNREHLQKAGEKLAAARRARGEKGATVAAATGISQGEISRIENGHYEGLKVTTLLKLCKYLGIPPEEILSET